ncbi:transporter substrate-binding domain-containing protein [Azohydromonas aeria]|uniref:transporter substrate-binding domain-containing protein n=1 Tax=Azohydromonas aeria TaxID=2590212 RepID=UPI001E520812|nr:transporter substrate-binding domain-containing protein [Azohydromonas aeria]
MGLRFSRLVAPLLLGAAVLTGCQAPGPSATSHSVAAPASAEASQVLAPSGVLRVAVYPGSPTSLVRRPGSDEARGLSVEIGRELALRLGVPVQLVEFERVEQVVEALRTARADMTITNATASRAALVDITEPLVALELGYLVLPGSPVASLADVDRSGIRVGVSQGSSSQAALGRTFVHASLVPAPSLKAATDMLKERRIDAFATNKGILFQLADGLPGARVLEGRWGTELLAIAVPKGREGGKPYLDRFAASVRSQGLVQRAAERAGLRGLAEPQAR